MKSLIGLVVDTLLSQPDGVVNLPAGYADNPPFHIDPPFKDGELLEQGF